jgi:hypothetical protein
MSSLHLLCSCLKTGRRAGISCQHSTMKAYMRLGQSSGQGNSCRDLHTNQKLDYTNQKLDYTKLKTMVMFYKPKPKGFFTNYKLW